MIGILAVFFGLILLYSINKRFISFKYSSALNLLQIFACWIFFLRPLIYSNSIQHTYRIIKPEYFSYIFWFIFVSNIIQIILFEYLIKRNNIKTTVANILPSKRGSDNAIKFAYILVITDTFLRITNLHNAMENLIPIIKYSWEFLASILAYRLYYGVKIIKVDFVAWGLVLLQLILRIADSQHTTVYTIIISMLLAYFFRSRRIPYRTLLFAFIILVPAFLGRMAYRYDKVIDSWYGGAEMSLATSVWNGVEQLYTNLVEFEFDKIQHNAGTTGRFEFVSYFSHVIDQHENGFQKFRRGETFYWLPAVIIPRFLWSSKPKNILSTEISQDYGLKGNAKGSMNWPMHIELYSNFGTFGVLFGAMFAIINYWIIAFLKINRPGPRLLLMPFFLIAFIRIEANITIIYGDVFQSLFFLYVINLIYPFDTKWL